MGYIYRNMNKPRLPFDIEFLMESILSEDPDGVYDTEDKKIARWVDDAACAFFIYDTVSLLANGKTHFAITRSLLNARQKHNPIAYLKTSNKELRISNTAALKKEMQDGSVADVLDMFEREMEETGEDMENLYDDVYTDGRIKYCISGRVWPDKKIISFWNDQAAVVKGWDRVERMFSEFKKTLGSLDDYVVDFVERTADTSQPLVSAKTISASRKPANARSDSNQMNFLDKLSDEQLRVLQRKIHTMKPQEKKRALQAMGASNHKASDIAAKLGMSVAEFNHIMNVNEGEEDKMPDLIDLAKQLSKQ